MKFGRLIEYNVKNISFVKKALKKDKANDQHLNFNVFW